MPLDPSADGHRSAACRYPIPVGDSKGNLSNEDTKGLGCPDVEALILPRGGFQNAMVVPWFPVARSDIAWNFEKFLVGPDGAFVKRFSRYYPTTEIASDIDELL